MKKIAQESLNNVKKNFKKIDSKIWIQLGIMALTVAVPIVMNGGICEASEMGTSNTSNLPWNTGLNTLVGQISGPIPRVAAILACAATGMMMAFGEMQGMAKKGVQIVFGMSIAIGAASLVTAVSGTTVSGCFF